MRSYSLEQCGFLNCYLRCRCEETTTGVAFLPQSKKTACKIFSKKLLKNKTQFHVLY